MAVLSLTAAGLSMAFAPAATAHPGAQGDHDYYSSASQQTLNMYVNTPSGGKSMTAGQVHGSVYNLNGNRAGNGQATSYSSNPAAPVDVQAINRDTEPNGVVGAVTKTGPAGSVDVFTFGASTNTLEVNQSEDTHTCVPLGVPLYEASSSTSVNIANLTTTAGTFDPFTAEAGEAKGYVRGSMFAIEGSATRRGVLTEARSNTGTYHLLDNTITVEIVKAATSLSKADGVTTGTADAVGATVRVTDAAGNVTTFDDTTLNQIRTFTDPATGRVLTLRINTVGENNNFATPGITHHNVHTSISVVQADYQMGQTFEGSYRIGTANTQSYVRMGGAECSSPLDTDNDGLSDAAETQVHATNPNLADTDDDGLKDGDEVNIHKTQPLVKDTDNDTLNDGAEVTLGTKPLVADTDEDGLYDGAEVNTIGTKPLVADTDEDGLSDGDEVNKYNSHPLVKDTDEDGLDDGVEVNENANGYTSDPRLPDTDGGKSSDFDEASAGTDPRDATDDYRLQDADLDGLTGAEEDFHDTDPDNPDTDGDSLTDGAEVNTHDTDPTRDDSDEDGLKDGDEVARGTDAGHPDTDGDMLEDGPEVNTHLTDPKVADTDDDGLDDGDEVRTYETKPLVKDTDEDGLTDGAEVNKHDTDPTRADSDNDGVNDGTEIANGTKPWDEDTDRDNLTDGGEVTAGTNPLVQDTDEDGLWDGDEVRIGSSPLKRDTDGGSVDDWTEYDRGTNPLDANDDVPPVVPPTTDPPVVPPTTPDKDSDNDGLTDAEEAKLGTDPLSKHSDGDRLGDAREVKLGTNPLRKDTDRDGLGDFREVVKTKTNPLRKDTDRDGVNDLREVKAGSNPNKATSTPHNR